MRDDDRDDRHTPTRPSKREVEEGLDEVEFYVASGLDDDARELLLELLETWPKHPLVLERLEELDQRAAARAQEPASTAPSYAHDDPPTGEIDAEAVLARFQRSAGGVLSLEDCDTHYDLGVAYQEMGLLDDAIGEFKIAASSPARRCVGETLIGRCYMEKGDVASALDHFERGLQTPRIGERDELGLRFEMGHAYESLGDLAGALRCFQRVAERDPSFRDVEQRLLRLRATFGESSGDPSN